MKSSLIFFVVILITFKTVLGDYSNATKKFVLRTDLKASWYRANHYCISNGMRLARIASEEENKEVQQLIADSGFSENFWVGGTNLGNEPYFYWMGHDQPMKFTDWAEGQPSNTRGRQNCIEISTPYSPYQSQWNDYDCSGLNNFICEELHA